ncbi:monovalent cation/H+ antiporter complex subunit F [Thiovibrio sp. JS02]
MMHGNIADSTMEFFFILSGILLLLFMFMPLYRAIWGPTVIDRLVGVNVIGTKTTILIIIIGTLYNRVDMFVDIALTYALLNFIASLAAARFFQRHRDVGLEEDRAGGQSC